MKIDPAAPLAMPQQDLFTKSDPKAFTDTKAPQRNAATPANSSGDQVQLNIAVPRQAVDTLQKIGNINMLSNSTAKSLRDTATGLSQSTDLLDKMKAKLETITKNFPPFPIDSTERKDLLMSYRSIQKEIEKLTVPPPPPPIYDKVAGMWQDVFGSDQAGSIPTIQLPDNASDAAVAQTAEQLSGTSQAVTKLNSAISTAL